MSQRAYRWAICGVAAALVAFAFAAGAILATGNDPTQSFWTIASGLSGALIGILASSPLQTQGSRGERAARNALGDAARAQAGVAAQHSQAAAQALKTGDAASAQAESGRASAAAQLAKQHASDAKQLGGLPLPIALAVLIALVVGCEWLLLFHHPHHLALEDAKQLRALAAAAGGGALGLLVPSPAN